MSINNLMPEIRMKILLVTLTLASLVTLTESIPNVSSDIYDPITNKSDSGSLEKYDNSNNNITNDSFIAISKIEQVRVSIVPGATQLTDTAYSPNPIEIHRGQTVLWVNEDSGFHTVTSGEINDPNSGVLFDSGLDGPTMISSKGKTFEYQFNVPGVFPYYCILHPGMVGTVIVS